MIRTAVADDCRVITIDRPARHNALRPADLTALANAFRAASEPVVYLHGTGDSFCAGADLDVIDSLDGETATAFARHGQRVADTIEGYDGAVVAGIDGAARGGGVELALAADIRLATPDSTFAESGVTLGLFGAWGGTARLPGVVGAGMALDLGLSGRTINAEQARSMGLVSRVVADPKAVARDIADNDPRAIRVLKERLRDDADSATQREREAAAFAELIERRNRNR